MAWSSVPTTSSVVRLRPTYIGQLKWAPKEARTNALFNVVVTDPTFDQPDNFPFYNITRWSSPTRSTTS